LQLLYFPYFSTAIQDILVIIPYTCNNMVTIDKQKKRSFLPSWFRPNCADKVRWFAIWLLVWNCAALADALAFTFMPASNLDGYYGAGRWNDVTFAQTRMLANCQLGLVSLVSLVGFTGNESQIRNVFRILFLTTIGALRGVALGMKEGRFYQYLIRHGHLV